MKKFIEEFKAFALRGNVMDMAIGVIIGGAFTSIVTSLTENLINPILGLLGGTDLSGFVLNLGGVELRYGAFITSIINFLIMAFVLFCLLKAVIFRLRGDRWFCKACGCRRKYESGKCTCNKCPWKGNLRI